MDYRLFITNSCERELNKLPQNIFNRIIIKIKLLSSNPYPHDSKKLKGVEGYRIREGEYRILYIILNKENVVEIFSVAHRKDVYRF